MLTDTHTTASGNTLGIRGGVLVVTRDGKRVTTTLLRKTTAPSTAAAAALRKGGKDPSDFRTLNNSINFQVPDADWVDAQHKAYQAECNSPANVERGEIEGMFNRAEGQRDYPGVYFNSLHRAESALAAWRTKYPAYADAEDARNRKDRADALRRTAQGALLYDADGSIGPEEQQRRHDEMMAEADRIEEGK
jgi:hypothetical protein